MLRELSLKSILTPMKLSTVPCGPMRCFVFRITKRKIISATQCKKIGFLSPPNELIGILQQQSYPFDLSSGPQS